MYWTLSFQLLLKPKAWGFSLIPLPLHSVKDPLANVGLIFQNLTISTLFQATVISCLDFALASYLICFCSWPCSLKTPKTLILQGFALSLPTPWMPFSWVSTWMVPLRSLLKSHFSEALSATLSKMLTPSCWHLISPSLFPLSTNHSLRFYIFFWHPC